MAAPRVTVIIPCYNYAQFLADCVASVLAQESVEVEAMIIDDGSTDGSRELAARLASSDARVTVVQHDRNIGHIATYNEGLSKATGDYIVLISADDMLTSGSLARATAVMEARPEVGLVYGNPVVIYGSEVTAARTRLRGTRVWRGPDWVSAQCRRVTSCIYSPEVCVRASVHRTVGGYNPMLPHTGDLELWLRIASVASVARVNSDQAYKRVHGGGMIQTSYASFLADLRGRRDAYESFFAGPGASLPRARHDLRVAHRGLAREAVEHVCSELSDRDRDASQLQEYLEFAVELHGPDVVRLLPWREYRLAVRNGGRAAQLRAAALRSGSVRRDVKTRYKWWRWRLTGV